MISWKDERLCFLDKLVHRKPKGIKSYLVGNISLTDNIFPGVIRVLSLDTWEIVDFVPLEESLQDKWNGNEVIYHAVSVLCSKEDIEQIRKRVTYLIMKQ